MNRHNAFLSALIFCILALTAVTSVAMLSGSGMISATKKTGSSRTGCTCHSMKPSDGVRVWVEGPQHLTPGATGVYTVFISGEDPEAAGFNAAVAHGTLGVSDSVMTQLDNGELTHLTPKEANGSDTVKWMIRYTAPSNGTVSDTIFTSALLANYNGVRSGDRWNLGHDFIIAVSGTAVDPELGEYEELFQASLFQRETTTSPILDLQMNVAERAKVEVYTLDGKLVTSIKDEQLDKGEHIFPVPYEKVPAGTFYCRITVRDQVDAIKFLIVK